MLPQVWITQQIDQGDGTVQVHGRTRTGSDVHVVVGHDLIASGQVFDLLLLAGAKMDRLRSQLRARARDDTEG